MSNSTQPNQAANLSMHDPFAGPAILKTVSTTEPQREIWTAAQIGDDASLAYNESITLWMRGPLNLDALRASLADVVARHEALRSTFDAAGLAMIVGADSPLGFDVIDASGQSPSSTEAIWSALLEREVTQPFDLVRGPLARVKALRVGPDEHRVTFTAHHMVCDGWSTAVVVRDWAAYYSARVSGTAAELAPADAFSSYVDEGATSENARLAAADEAYWVERFASDIPVLELPSDRPRPRLKTFASRREDLVLDPALVRELRRVGSADKASLFVTLFAAFEALLARLSGQPDLVVGIPAAGQSIGGHESLVGHCVNILPLRGRVDFERPFRALIADARGVVLEAYDHQRCTFGSLLKRLPLARDPSRLPLVSVLFNVDRGMTADSIQFKELHTQLTTNPRHFENFDVFLNAVELGGKVTLECQYNTDLFDRQTVARWLACYERLLRSVCERPDERVGWLKILPDEELARLDGHNAETVRPLEPLGRVDELIAAQVARTPEAVAVEQQGVRLSYAELDSKAEALAWQLRGLGVGPGSLVGLCVERSPDMVVGLLGILKAGGAYVPLDPAYPIERLSFMVRDSRMTTLVTQARLRAELPLDVKDVVLLDHVEPRKDPVPDSGGAAPNDPAYVIYTSGSTGTPKGVLVPHRAVVNFLASVREAPGLSADDVLLAVTTLSFDIAVLELYLPLTVGAKVVIASREVASDGAALLAAVRAQGVTFMQATPSTWRLLLAAGWSAQEPIKVLCGGEPLPVDLARELVKRSPSVWNMYGPTETTVWSTRWRVDERAQRILIGKPLANTDLYVLDARGQRVPTGVVGELFIGGAGVTLGYHDRAELTRERFLPDPFRGGDARMYKTGDLARILVDGNVECLGRNDTQVKLRGFRIELGEIENVLAQHPSVLQAVAIVREDRPGDARLVAYTTLRPNASASDSELRTHLKKTLPEYMLPQHFVQLDRIPLLPNGKVNRRALPAPDLTQVRTGEEFVAPRTPTEEMLATLWQEVLAIGRVSVHDDFFALGGHSLLATQVIARLRRDRGVEVSFRKMFEAPTIEKLAAVIDASGTASAAPQSRIVPRGGGPARLSVAQRRMWLLEEMDPAQRASHNLCASWRLDGLLDAGALQRAVDEIARRHEMLRANFVVKDGEPTQTIHAGRTVPLRALDLRGERDPLLALSADRDAQATIPFDLAADPLIRVTLYKLADDRHVLSTVQHNIIWDGWSFDIFLRELSALYGAFARGEPSPLPPLPIAYTDFAEWQQEWIGSPEFEKAASFWRTQLSGGILPLDFPTDAPRKGTRSQAGASEGVHISTARADALSALARENSATLFMVVFAAYCALLYRHTGQRELLVGIPMRARTRPELEDLIGPFVNVVALRTKLTPSMTFLELLEAVREGTFDAFGHQEVPIDALGIRPPMLRALFSLQDARSRPVQLGDVNVTQEHALAPVAASELMLWAMESKSSLLLMLNFATDLFHPATARRLLRELDTLLEEVQRDPRQRVGSVPILPSDEREAIARAGGDAAGSTPDDVLSLIRHAGEPDLESVAIQCEDRTLSYAQLLRRTRAFAGDLVLRGVVAGSRVAVRLPKADDRLLVMLAVLGLGATCALTERDQATVVVNDIGERPESGTASSASARAVAYVDQGVAVDHGALALSLRAVASAVAMRPGDVVVVSSRLDSASGICAALLPLIAGARLVLSSTEDPDTLLAAVADSKPASVLLASPATWRAIPEIHAAAVVVFGNPSIPLRSKLAAGSIAAFVAPTCAALGLPASIHRVSPEDNLRLLGRPLAGMRWRVVDPQGEIAPLGVAGELHVDFAGEARATGDRVRLSADGVFEHLGRLDGRVDLDGLVDLPQIGAALKSHPAVEDAFAAVRDDPAGASRIVAYCVPRPGASYTETELRKHVRDAMGDRHVPRMFVELDALPRDAAGAVDDERLPSPYAVSAVNEYRGPRTEAEKYIASVWQDALGVARIGVHDNFFDLGGHSLLCFRIIARIERDTGKRVSPRVVLLNTLEQLATDLEGARIAHERPALVAQSEGEAAEVTDGKPRPKDLFGRLRGFLKR